MYTVKEMAQELGLTSHAIRYYTDQKLIPHVTRDKNNNRLFDDEAKLWLMNVKYMRNCGMSIQDIKRYIALNNEGPSTVMARFNILVQQKEIIHQKIKELQESADYLDKKMAYYTKTFFDAPTNQIQSSSLEELAAGISK